MNFLLSSIYHIGFIDYFFQLVCFIPFLSFFSSFNNKYGVNNNFELLVFILAFFDEDELVEEEFLPDIFPLREFLENDNNISLTFNFHFNDFLSHSENYDSFYSDFTTENFLYSEFFNGEFSYDFDFFETFFIAAIMLSLNYFFAEIAEEESSNIINFVQFSLTILSFTDDLFMLFLGFELLTISIVLSILLIQEKYIYNRSLIIYYVMSVAISLIIFFFCFLIILLCSDLTFFSFLNFSNFIFDVLIGMESTDDEFTLYLYNYCLKFFFLNLIILFMFKFTVGPIAIWTFYIYPSFPIFALIFQMVFFKYSLYFLFLEIFDFVFLFDQSLANFFLKVFSFVLIISMFLGCLAYKVNDLKTIFIITTFSQIAYISVGFLSPSFMMLVYSLNYFLMYIYSTFAVFLILIIANTVYNVQTLQDLGLLRYIDFGLFLNLIVIIFSMAGIPPFLPFFFKLVLIIKVLTSPFLFTFGIALLLTSFITTYIYLSIIYNLIKTSNNFKNQTQIQNALLSKIDFHQLGFPVVTLEILTFLFNSFIGSLVLLFVSPIFITFIIETENLYVYFEMYSFWRFFEFLEYYFAN